jgi:hypothetical protein
MTEEQAWLLFFDTGAPEAWLLARLARRENGPQG